MRGALKRSVCTVCGRVCIVVSRVCLTDRGFESGGSVLGLLSWSLSEPLGSIWTCSVANSIRWIVFTIHTEQTFFKRGSSWDPSDSEAIQGYSVLFHPNIGFQSYLFGCLGKTVLRSKCRRSLKKKCRIAASKNPGQATPSTHRLPFWGNNPKRFLWL